MNRLKFRKKNPMAGETHQEQGFPLALLPSKRVLRHCGISTWAAGTAEISHHLHIWNSWWREKVRMSSLGSSLSPARLLAGPAVSSDLSPAASSSRSIYFLFCQGSYRQINNQIQINHGDHAEEDCDTYWDEWLPVAHGILRGKGANA